MEAVKASIGDTKLWSEYTLLDLADYVLSDYADVDLVTLSGFHPLIKTNTLDAEYAVEERTLASFTVVDEDDEYHFSPEQEVIIKDVYEDIIFGGIVSSVQEVPISPSAGLEHRISIADYQIIADWRLFNDAYESETAGNIVRDILVILAEEGITEGLIQNGETLTDIIFAYVMCSEALAKLAELCGFIWFISEEKKLYFCARDQYPAAWNIADGSEMLLETSQLTRAITEYRNCQYIEGGSAETSPQIEPFIGDGESRSFVFGYPFSQVPVITLNGNPQTVGIKGIEIGKNWYWSKGDPIITQDMGDPVLESTDVGEATYIGQYKLMAIKSSAAEITRRQGVIGFGTGKLEKFATDSYCDTKEMAEASAEAKLAVYARPGICLEYETLADGLAAGVIQTVTIPRYNLSAEEMLITALSIYARDSIIVYRVTAIGGPFNDTWTKFFMSLSETARKRDSEAVGWESEIIGLYSFEKTWLDGWHPNPFIDAVPGTTPEDDDFPSLALYDKLSYVVLYKAGVEFFRKAITSQSWNETDTEIYTTAIILSGEGNDTISHVALWGGDDCSLTPGSGIEMSKHAWIYTKTLMESLQFEFTDIKGWV